MSELSFESKRLNFGELAHLVILFYGSTQVRNSFSSSLRVLVVSVAVLEAWLAKLGGRCPDALLVYAEGETVGGVMVGHRGTVFNASLNYAISPLVARELANSFHRSFMTGRRSHLALWTSSPAIVRLTTQLGFLPTEAHRYIEETSFGPLRFAVIKSGSKPKTGSRVLKKMEWRYE